VRTEERGIVILDAAALEGQQWSAES